MTTSGDKKCGTQLDRAVAARGASRSKTVSANGIGDTEAFRDLLARADEVIE
jgi:hypothetical protein